MLISRQSNITVVSTINFNSATFTTQLIDSLINANLRHCKVVVCDNNSSDNSCENIVKHLQKKECSFSENFDLQNNDICSEKQFRFTNDLMFFFLELKENYGFAKATNIAYEYANNSISFKYFWLLNNDATILNSTLPKLIEAAKKHNDNILLSSLIFEDNTRRAVWFSGGVYNKYFAIGLSSLLAETNSILLSPI